MCERSTCEKVEMPHAARAGHTPRMAMHARSLHTRTRQFTSVRVRVDKHMRTRVTHLLPRQSHLMNLRQQQRARVTICVRSNPTSPTRSCQQHPSHLPMSPPHPPRRQQMRPSRTHHAAASQAHRRHPRSVATWNTLSPLVLCHRGLLLSLSQTIVASPCCEGVGHSSRRVPLVASHVVLQQSVVWTHVLLQGTHEARRLARLRSRGVCPQTTTTTVCPCRLCLLRV